MNANAKVLALAAIAFPVLTLAGIGAGAIEHTYESKRLVRMVFGPEKPLKAKIRKKSAANERVEAFIEFD